MKAKHNKAVEEKEQYKNRLDKVLEENEKRKECEADLGRLKAHMGARNCSFSIIN